MKRGHRPANQLPPVVQRLQRIAAINATLKREPQGQYIANLQVGNTLRGIEPSRQGVINHVASRHGHRRAWRGGLRQRDAGWQVVIHPGRRADIVALNTRSGIRGLNLIVDHCPIGEASPVYPER